MTAAYSWLHDAVSGGAVVLTPTRRLARALAAAYGDAQLRRGLQSWRTPQVHSLDQWLNALLNQCDDFRATRLRLGAQASAVVWEEHVNRVTGELLLNPRGLVRQAQQAWQRLNDWCVSIDELRRYAVSDDERHFAEAAANYASELEANAWIDPAQVASAVVRLLKGRVIAAPDAIVCAGFDRLTPAVRAIFRELREQGATIHPAPERVAGKSVKVLSLGDPDAELRAAGAWARGQLLADDRARIAVVCPRLEQDAPRAARLVREGLAPGWQYGGNAHATSVNVSYGRRLSAYPLIDIALTWLKWSCQGLLSVEVSRLLRSGFACGANLAARSRLEKSLRRLPDRRWRPSVLAAALRGARGDPEDGHDGGEAADWFRRVQALTAIEAERKRLESPAIWAGRIDELLSDCGWPGDAALDSIEFQLVQRWRELLNEFSTLQVVRPRIQLGEAVARLTSLASECLWQPETGPGLVQLLGPLEAAGLEFDHVWVSSLDAGGWPPQAHPMPLISRRLQRKLEMPDATPADTLEFSARILRRLTESAGNVVLSWPATDEDLDLEPSPLLEHYPGSACSGEDAGATGGDPGWHAAALAGLHAIEKAPEDRVPPVRRGETIRGGATTVQRQADDPFSAFAYGRLGIADLRKFEPGIAANVRGNIVHRALHALYAGLPASAEIASWSGAGFEQRTASIADAAIGPELRHADGVLRRLLAIERRRLRNVLRSFIEEEMRRESFAVIAVEKALDWSRHDVRLNMRIDRIDRLADGRLVIADYKSGAAKNFVDRHGDPVRLQLVVYSCAVDEAIGGLVLINVDNSGIAYRGAGRNVDWDRSAPEEWEGRLHSWQALVDARLAEFAAGDVRTCVGPGRNNRALDVLSRAGELKDDP